MYRSIVNKRVLTDEYILADILLVRTFCCLCPLQFIAALLYVSTPWGFFEVTYVGVLLGFFEVVYVCASRVLFGGIHFFEDSVHDEGCKEEGAEVGDGLGDLDSQKT